VRRSEGAGGAVKLENAHYSVRFDEANGAIESLVARALQCELVGEPRLRANFRLLLPLKDYEANYLDGMEQTPTSLQRDEHSVTVRFERLKSQRGTFDVTLACTVALEDDAIVFRATLTNREPEPVAEFWFPQIGGLRDLCGRRDARLSLPGYVNTEPKAIFTTFPTGQSFGEPSERSRDYPGPMVMPWWDLHDPTADVGLYLGYHDVTCRCSTWHLHLHPTASGRPDGAWLRPEEAAGQPVGLVFSHVRYPFIRARETYATGEFVLRAHPGDWHAGAKHYRRWFDQHWKIDKSRSWLRRKSAWFTSVAQWPEDRITADYATYDQWCQDAQRHGITCYELIGWDQGGLERDYPHYVPEAKLGGRPAFRKLLRSIDARGG